MTARRVWIYALVDPRDMLPRYVGQSRNPTARYDGHTSSTTTNAMRPWRRDVFAAGLMPHMLLLERVLEPQALFTEGRWIDEGKRRGWPLLNVVRRKRRAA